MNRAFAIFLFSVVSILLGIFALTYNGTFYGFTRRSLLKRSVPFVRLALSTGITADLATGSKFILMLSMLVGRVGTLTLAFALSGQRQEVNTFKYPKANIHVG